MDVKSSEAENRLDPIYASRNVITASQLPCNENELNGQIMKLSGVDITCLGDHLNVLTNINKETLSPGSLCYWTVNYQFNKKPASISCVRHRSYGINLCSMLS